MPAVRRIGGSLLVWPKAISGAIGGTPVVVIRRSPLSTRFDFYDPDGAADGPW
jgi:hypothetical protein